jgi:hypothetical protein
MTAVLELTSEEFKALVTSPEYPKMDPIVKQLWVDALRSDDYRQTSGVLCRGNKSGLTEYCVFGVLVELWKQHHHVSFDSGVSDVDGSYPGNDVLVWAGLPAISSIAGNLIVRVWQVPHVIRVLMAMNDTGETFPDLAKFIDGNL